MATKNKTTRQTQIEEKLNELRLTAGVSRKLDLWARYEGACEALRWAGYKVTVEGGKHRVAPC